MTNIIILIRIMIRIRIRIRIIIITIIIIVVIIFVVVFVAMLLCCRGDGIGVMNSAGGLWKPPPQPQGRGTDTIMCFV